MYADGTTLLHLGTPRKNVCACARFELKSIIERLRFDIENGGLLHLSVYLGSFKRKYVRSEEEKGLPSFFKGRFGF